MMNSKNRNTKTIFNIRCDILVILFLVITTLSVYWQVRNHEFLIWDDNFYVTENRHVLTGLNLENISWSLTTRHAFNWHPLTWLSHMLDIQLYGMNSGSHHLTNLLIHTINSILLFLIFNRMTNRLWQSGFVAALFALHPLHVESVAWLSERKDVLSTFFWMLTVWSYAWYVERPRINRYLLVIFFFILGLMSKPMLVTLPFILLLIDFWPLNRLSIKRIKSSILWEKVPFFALSTVSSVITFIVQQRSGAFGPIDFVARISNSLVSYVSYIGKMIWPFHLTFFYPHPIVLPKWQVTGACLILITIFFLVMWQVRRYPWLAVGWLWYVGALVPVIGLVQVGEQSMADRYTYVPLVGLFIIIAWGFPELMGKWYNKKLILSLLVTALFSICMVTSWRQAGYWKSDIMVNAHALDVTKDNYVAHNNLGLALAEQGKTTDAIRHYTEALKIKPVFVHAYINLGVALAVQGRLEEAVKEYKEALSIKPRFAGAHNNLGFVLATQGKTEDAIRHYKEALRINPNYVKAHNNLGLVLAEQGRAEEAAKHYAEALRIDPYFTNALNNLGIALIKQDRLKDAENLFRRVLRIDSGDEKGRYNLKKLVAIQRNINLSIKKIHEELKNKPEDFKLHYKLGNLYKSKGETDKAIDQYEKALAINPQFIDALNHLTIAYAMQGEYKKGLNLLKTLVKRQPDIPETHYLVASMYARQDNVEKSIHWLKLAVKKGYDNWQRIKTDSNLENVRSSSEYRVLIKDH